MSKAISHNVDHVLEADGNRERILINAHEVAALLGIGRTTWLSLHSAGKTPSEIRLGRSVKWRREELLKWTEAGCPIREKWEQMKARNYLD